MVSVLRAIPVATPVRESTDTLPEELFHRPPGGELASGEEVPTQNEVIPVMVVGSGLTVNVV
jgi:hypothetical protein